MLSHSLNVYIAAVNTALLKSTVLIPHTVEQLQRFTVIYHGTCVICCINSEMRRRKLRFVRQRDHVLFDSAFVHNWGNCEYRWRVLG